MRTPSPSNEAHAFRLSRTLGLVVVALALSGAAGCVKKPYAPEPCVRPDGSSCVIEDVVITGNSVPASAIKDRISTIETSRVLGGSIENIPVLSIWDRLTVDYGRLDPFVLERDLARVERAYRALGYYEARARAGRIIKLQNDRVRVEIAVDEGLPVTITAVKLEWKTAVVQPGKEALLAIAAARRELLKVGKPFEEEPFEKTKKLLTRAMTDHGYAYGSVEGHADVDLVKHKAVLVYQLDLGPRSTFGPITFSGLQDLPEDPLRASLGIKEGEEYSSAKLDSAQIALADFGVLGSIDVVPQLSPPDGPRSPVVPVLFKTQKAQLRTIKSGFGAEVGDIVETHGIIGWENRNFLGGLRRFTVEARPELVYYPMQLDTLFSQPPTQVLPEVEFRSELRQPLWFDPRTNFILRLGLNVYRLQSQDTVVTAATLAANENVVGYREIAGAVGAERTFWNSQQYIALFHNVQFDDPFSYNLNELPLGYSSILISYLEAIGSVDLRRNAEGKPDKLHPHVGFLFSNDVQVAGYVFGGDASDVRVRPELRVYLPVTRKTTIAFRQTFGFLFPSNYAKSIENATNQTLAQCATTSAADIQKARDLQLLQFRAFFSGGANSNRGYPYNGVGPQEDASFLSQGLVCGTLVATGGLSLWETSLEWRFPMVGKLGAVIFVDASDVRREPATVSLSSPHISSGIGLRYDTPVGPLRGDLGVRIPCAQVIGSCTDDLPAYAGQAQLIAGLPLAVSIAIGEAY